MNDALAELKEKRKSVYDRFAALAGRGKLASEESREFDRLEEELKSLDRRLSEQNGARDRALKVAAFGGKASACVPDDPYVSDEAAAKRGFGSAKGMVTAGFIRTAAAAKGTYKALDIAQKQYGDRHPVTELAGAARKALGTSAGPSGGFVVPPDYAQEVLDLLRPEVAVRAAGPVLIEMPRGSFTLPRQASAATAYYAGESSAIPVSEPSFDQLTMTYKKLTGLVSVSNDLLRYASPSVDALVRDDLIRTLALRQDLAFLQGDGTDSTPRGLVYFANQWAIANGGAAASWRTGQNSTAGSGGNFVASASSYSLATAASELGGLVNKLDAANVPDKRRCWFMNPRTFNYLYNVQNSLGLYVFRDELTAGSLLGYPFRKTTQIPVNLWDATGANRDASYVALVEMTEALLFDALALEVTISTEGGYMDASGAWRSAFQSDFTVVRAIAEHDFVIRRAASVAILQFVRWSPVA